MSEWRARRQRHIQDLKQASSAPYRSVETADMKDTERQMQSRAVLSPRKHPATPRGDDSDEEENQWRTHAGRRIGVCVVCDAGTDSVVILRIEST